MCVAKGFATKLAVPSFWAAEHTTMTRGGAASLLGESALMKLPPVTVTACKCSSAAHSSLFCPSVSPFFVFCTQHLWDDFRVGGGGGISFLVCPFSSTERWQLRKRIACAYVASVTRPTCGNLLTLALFASVWPPPGWCTGVEEEGHGSEGIFISGERKGKMVYGARPYLFRRSATVPFGCASSGYGKDRDEGRGSGWKELLFGEKQGFAAAPTLC